MTSLAIKAPASHLTVLSITEALRISAPQTQVRITASPAALRISNSRSSALRIGGKPPSRLNISQPTPALRFVYMGPPGPRGPPGGAEGAFLIVNRFAELDTAQAKTDARTHLELQAIDCGVFL